MRFNAAFAEVVDLSPATLWALSGLVSAFLARRAILLWDQEVADLSDRVRDLETRLARIEGELE
jgi:hypothetical protein